MRKLICLLFFVSTSYLTNAQAGLFVTYSDYLNNNIIEYPTFIGISCAFEHYKINFYDAQGKRASIDVDTTPMWGFRESDGDLMRVDAKKNLRVVMTFGRIIVYGNFMTHTYYGHAKMGENVYTPYCSWGLNGEMVKLKKKNLMKMLAGDAEAIQKLQKIKNNDYALYKFVLEYNEQFEKVDSD